MKKNSGKTQKSKKSSASVKSIMWKSVKVKAKLIDPTPNNYKIKSDLGRERLQTSLGKYGRAGTVVCNYSKKKGRFDIVDGNSRWEDQMAIDPNGIMEISVPSRILSSAEYREMSAMFDFAKAGEVDTDRIVGELGTSKDFFAKWGLEMPMEMLAKMGKNSSTEDLEYPEEGETKSKGRKGEEPKVSGIRLVQAFFTEQQEESFRKMEEKMKGVLKIDNTTDFVFKCVEFTFKALNKGVAQKIGKLNVKK